MQSHLRQAHNNYLFDYQTQNQAQNVRLFLSYLIFLFCKFKFIFIK